MAFRYIYDCPCCRRWDECASEHIWRLCRENKCCTTCVETDFRRLRRHILRIEVSLYFNPDMPFMDEGVPNGIIAWKVADGGDKAVYRALWAKRKRQLAAARQCLIDAGADPDAIIKVERGVKRPPTDREIVRHLVHLLDEAGVDEAHAWVRAVERQFDITIRHEVLVAATEMQGAMALETRQSSELMQGAY